MNRYILIHLVQRTNRVKSKRKIEFFDQESALNYMYKLRDFETVLLFKKEQRKAQKVRF